MSYLISPYHNDTLLMYHQKWFIKKNENLIYLDLSNFEVIVNLYPFLEKDEEFYLSSLHNVEAINSFPYIEIIYSGFMQNTDFWVGRSVEWLSKKNIYDWLFFVNFFEEIEHNKGFSQKTRQSVRKMVDKTRTYMRKETDF